MGRDRQRHVETARAHEDSNPSVWVGKHVETFDCLAKARMSREAHFSSLGGNLDLGTRAGHRLLAHADPEGLGEVHGKGQGILPPSETGPVPTDSGGPAPTAGYPLVSSRNSQVFHRPDCRWVQNIAGGNLVGYRSRDEAVQAGKRPCKTCKP